MNGKNFPIRKIIFSLILISFFIVPLKIYAATSANYEITKDSINIGGNDNATSGTYSGADTVGESATGDSGSANYGMMAGYRNDTEDATLSFSLTGNSINLGTLTSSSVSQQYITANVSTGASYGYILDVVADGDLRNPYGNIIQQVADGTVTAGSNEYGLNTVGIDGLYNGSDTSITIYPSLKTVAQHITNAPTAISTELHFKASVNATNRAGQYHQNVTVIAVGNF